ncbi:hypothetical protein AND_010449 [Anopheles darlingi]|uniref:Uncharacterized protein n=1 Tax=Anopheles darlingi TaxID=43151 RepID=W5J5F7_ANODA|nr:hypothetical protein AND_010449 [Anopheles darlingi]
MNATTTSVHRPLVIEFTFCEEFSGGESHYSFLVPDPRSPYAGILINMQCLCQGYELRM